MFSLKQPPLWFSLTALLGLLLSSSILLVGQPNNIDSTKLLYTQLVNAFSKTSHLTNTAAAIKQMSTSAAPTLSASRKIIKKIKAFETAEGDGASELNSSKLQYFC